MEARKRSIAAGIALAAGLLPAAAAEVAVEARLGFDGARPASGPTPLAVRLENRTGLPVRARLTVRDRGGLVAGASSVVRGIEVSAGAVRQASLLVPDVFTEPVLRIDGADKQDWVMSGGEMLEGVRSIDVRLETVATGVRMLVLGARARQVVGALTARPGEALGDGDRAWAPAALAEEWAPDSWLAYSGVETIVWVEPDLARLPDPAQLRAIDEFVRLGGALVLLSAGRPERLDDPRLASLLPGPVSDVGTTEYPAPPSFEEGAFGGAFPVIEIDVPAEASARSPGRTPAWLRGLPGVLHHHVGRGSVAVARFDPLRYDLGDPEVFAAALERASGLRLEFESAAELDVGGAPGWLGPLGGGAFFGMLANENVLTPPLGMFVLFGFLFVLLIGPVDYVVLKRLGRLKWSPWTLLGYTALFSGASIGATYVLFAPDEEVNRIAIVDLDEAADGEERMSGWLYHGIYAPYGGTYRPGVVGGQVFGGLATERTHGMWGQVTASRDLTTKRTWTWVGPGAQPLALEMPFNSLRVTAQRFSGRPLGTVDGTFDVVPTGGWTLRVHNGLPSTLRSVRLATDEGFLELGDLPPGETVARSITRDSLREEGELRPFEELAGEPWSFFHVGSDVPRGSNGMPDPTGLRDALVVSSVQDTPAGRARLSPSGLPFQAVAPWRVEDVLLRDHALLLAMTDALPFDDGLGDAPAGFTDVLVRRAVELPWGLR